MTAPISLQDAQALPLGKLRIEARMASYEVGHTASYDKKVRPRDLRRAVSRLNRHNDTFHPSTQAALIAYAGNRYGLSFLGRFGNQLANVQRYVSMQG